MAQQVTMAQWMDGIKTLLTQRLEEQSKALPHGFDRERFILNCMTMLREMAKDDDKKKSLAECKPESIIMCFLKGAFLGLDFYNGECYMIPYKKECNFQTHYKGEIKLCKKYSRNKIRDIYAKNVREGDFYEEAIIEGRQVITWKPIPFNDAEIIGSFAVVLYEDGSMLYDSMSKKMIEKTREDYSKAKNSTAWLKSPGEMYKKTVLRRLTKLVDIDFDNAEQIRAFQDGGDATFEPAGAIEKKSEEVADVFAEVREPKQIEEKPAETVPTFTQEREKEPVPVQEGIPEEFAAYDPQTGEIPEDVIDDLPFR